MIFCRLTILFVLLGVAGCTAKKSEEEVNDRAQTSASSGMQSGMTPTPDAEGLVTSAVPGSTSSPKNNDSDISIISSEKHRITFDPIENASISENTPWKFELQATTTDEDAYIAFTCQMNAGPCPEGMVIDSDTVNWVPSFSQAGTYHFTFIADDGHTTASQSMSLIVDDANQIPAITMTPFDSPYKIRLSTDPIAIGFDATDADGPAVVKLYYAMNYLACDSTEISNWILITDNLATTVHSYEWSPSTSGIIYICGVVDDGQDQSYAAAANAILTLPADMKIWLKADAGVFQEDGRISQWQDFSGNDHNLSQEDQALRPNLLANAAGDLPAVQFDGIDDFFANAHSYDAQSVFISFRPNASLQQSSDLAGLWGSYQDSIHVAFDARESNRSFSFDGAGSSTAKYFLGDYSYSGLLANGVDTPWTYDEWNVVGVEFTSAHTLTETAVGGLSSIIHDSHRFGGAIGEIIVYDRSLTSPETIAIRKYLKDRWSEEVDTNPPLEVANLISPFQSNAKIALSWDQGAGSTTSFQVAYLQSATPPASCSDGSVIAESVLGNSTTALLTGLLPLTTYSYRVCSVNNATIPPQFSNGIAGTIATTENAPEPPQLNLSMWLNAGIGVISDGAGHVETWVDQSVNGFVVNQSALNKRPKIIHNQLSGHSVVRFDGIDDVLVGTNSYTSRSVFVVYKVSSIAMKNSALGQIWGQYAGAGHVALDARSSNLRGFSFDGNTANRAKYALDSEDYTPFQPNQNSQQWAYDTYQIVAVEFENDVFVSNECLGHLCSSFNTGEHQLGGDIAELLVYDSALDSSTRATIEDYLKEKYGL